MKYTEKEHAVNLLEMLKHENPCATCPAGSRFFDDLVCKTCREFVWLIGSGIPGTRCPCSCFGQDYRLTVDNPEAIKITWLALEAKGYI